MQTCKSLIKHIIPTMMLALPSFADEQLFGYSQTSEVIPQGGVQLYQWATQRQGKDFGKYQAQDYRTELEYGFTNRLQGSLYFNGRGHQINYAQAPETSTHLDTYYDGNKNTKFVFDGMQAAVKYNVLSPYQGHDIGLALYAEGGFSNTNRISGEDRKGYTFETMIALQKNFLEDRLVSVFNLQTEFERARYEDTPPGQWDDEVALKFTGGLTYLLASHWYIGAEALHIREWDVDEPTPRFRNLPKYGPLEHSVTYAGPVIHYANQRWWFTLTYLTQLHGWPYEPGAAHLQVIERERTQVRMKIAYNF